MKDNSTLATIGRLINTKSGGKLSHLGCEASKLKAQFELANSLNHKPIRVLKNWKRFRIETDKRKEQVLRQLQPSICNAEIYIVYSDEVVSDSTGRVPMWDKCDNIDFVIYFSKKGQWGYIAPQFHKPRKLNHPEHLRFHQNSTNFLKAFAKV